MNTFARLVTCSLLCSVISAEEPVKESAEYRIRLLRYSLQTRMMQQAWNSNDLPQARLWLEKLRPGAGEEDLRDFSWYYFNQLINVGNVIEHGAQCDSVRFSSDGSFLASAGGDVVKLWTLQGTKLKGQYEHEDARFVTFSPDGSMLASAPGHIAGSVKRSAQLWLTDPLQRISSFDGGESVVFSPDGRLLSVIVGPKVQLFDTRKREHVATLEGHTMNVRSVAFSPDGTRLATGSPDKTAKVWETTRGELLSTIDQHRFYVEAVAFWKSNSKLLTAERGGPVRLWDLESQKDTKLFKEASRFNDGNTGLIFSHDGDSLALLSHYSDSSFVDVCDMTTGQRLVRIEKPGSFLEAAFAANGPWLAVASKKDNVIELWNTETWIPEATFTFSSSNLLWLGDGVSLSPTGDKVALADGSSISLFAASPNAIAATGGFDFAKDSSELIYLDGSRIKFRSTDGDKATREFDIVHDQALDHVALTSDGSVRAGTVSDKPSVYVWRDTERKPQTLRLRVASADPNQRRFRPPSVRVLALSPSGMRVAAGGERIPLQIVDTRRERETTTIDVGERLSLVAVSDSNRVATAKRRTERVPVAINLWDATSGKKIAELGTHRDKPVALSFSQDGRYLASADIRSAKVWQLSNQKCIQTFEIRKRVSNPPEFNRTLAFFPDSKSIFVGVPGRLNRLRLGSNYLISAYDFHYWADSQWNLRESPALGSAEITLVAISNDGNKVAAHLADGHVIVWRVPDRTGIAVAHATFPAQDMAFSPNGEELVLGSTRFESFHIEQNTWRHLPSPSDVISTRSFSSCRFAYSPHEHIVATSTTPRRQLFADVRLWNATNGAPISHIRPRHVVHDIAFVPKSPILALAGPSAMTLWSTQTGELLDELEGTHLGSIAFSPDGKRVALYGRDGRARGVRVQPIDGGPAEFLPYTGERRINAVKFAPHAADRHLLAAAGDDRVVQIWDYKAGTELATLTGHSDAVFALEFSPDGRTLVSGGADAKLRFWDLITWTERLHLDTEDEIHDLSFAADGMSLVVGLRGSGIQLLQGSAR